MTHLTGQEYHDALHEDLYSQLCVAWEEWVEQQAEGDHDSPASMKATREAFFEANDIVVIGKDRSINHYRFKLERIG